MIQKTKKKYMLLLEFAMILLGQLLSLEIPSIHEFKYGINGLKLGRGVKRDVLAGDEINEKRVQLPSQKVIQEGDICAYSDIKIQEFQSLPLIKLP